MFEQEFAGYLVECIRAFIVGIVFRGRQKVEFSIGDFRSKSSLRLWRSQFISIARNDERRDS